MNPPASATAAPPYISQIKAVCVIDNLSGINTPKKIGPMLKMADIVVITKGDIVSQAEREVFAARVNMVNPAAVIMHINGLTGQGSWELSNPVARYGRRDQQSQRSKAPLLHAFCALLLLPGRDENRGRASDGECPKD